MLEHVQQAITWLTGSPHGAPLVLLALAIVLLGFIVPASEEILVFAAGVLVYQDAFSPFSAWVVCFIAILIADSITVFLGRHFGRALLHRRWLKRFLHPRRVLWAHHQVHDHGAWMIAASRFIPGSRMATMLITGMMHLPRWKFLLADSLAALVTVTAQLAAGYYVAANLDRLETVEHWLTFAFIVVGVLLIVGYVVWRRRRRRNRANANHRPRSLRRFLRRHVASP